MANLLSPFVYWAQSDSHVYLKVDIKDVKYPVVLIEEDDLEFNSAANIEGNKYNFSIEFYLPINKEDSHFEVTGREVRITLCKKEADWWPRLLFHPRKLPWLKIDFDRWKNETDSEEEEVKSKDLTQSVSSEDLLRNRYPNIYTNLQRQKVGYISESKRKIYLFCYNLFMLCGFLYAFTIMTICYIKEEEEFIPKAYSSVGNVFKMLHLMMFLEVLNPIFGYTKGSSIEPLLQVGGRNIVIFILIDSEERMQEKPVVFYLLVCYSVVELARYPYYMIRVYNIDIGLLTWLRYTLWIPIYPLGFICEGVIALRNIPYFEETEKFSVLLPNVLNFSFYFPTCLRLYLLNFSFYFPTCLRLYLLFGYFPIMYTIMWNMYHSRCKRLGIKQHKSNRKTKNE